MLVSFSALQLQGDNSSWICIKMYYPVPNTISVTHSNGNKTKSIVSTNLQQVTDYPNLCGTNKYFYRDNVIHFIVTGEADCIVRVSLMSSVQVTARLNVQINSFYQTKGEVKLIDLLSAYLGITTDRLKIVGVYSGSTIVDLRILPELPLIEDNTTIQSNSKASNQQLKQLSQKIASATNNQIPNLISVSSVLSIIQEEKDKNNPQTNDQVNQTNKTTVVIIGVVVAVSVFVIIGVFIWAFRKVLRRRRPIHPIIEQPKEIQEMGSVDFIRDNVRIDAEEKVQVNKEIDPKEKVQVNKEIDPKEKVQVNKEIDAEEEGQIQFYEIVWNVSPQERN